MKLTERLRNTVSDKENGVITVTFDGEVCGLAALRIERLEAALRGIIKAWDDDSQPDFMVALKKARAALAEAERKGAAKQAEIDRLMLEFCPGEMTPEQLAEWGRHQRAEFKEG